MFLCWHVDAKSVALSLTFVLSHFRVDGGLSEVSRNSGLLHGARRREGPREWRCDKRGSS